MTATNARNLADIDDAALSRVALLGTALGITTPAAGGAVLSAVTAEQGRRILGEHDAGTVDFTGHTGATDADIARQLAGYLTGIAASQGDHDVQAMFIRAAVKATGELVDRLCVTDS